MVRNRNGQFMDERFASRMKLNLQQFAEGGDGGDGGAAGDSENGGNDAGDNAGNGGAESSSGADADKGGDTGETMESIRAQMEKMKLEMAKQKAALDKATSEAGEARKALKAKMTQEEIDAANKKEAEEKREAELAELKKKVAKAESTKSVMSKLSVDEETAGSIAECLAGCEDVENVLLLIRKAWDSKEKALRKEFGKIPGPGTGGDTEDKEMKAALELAKEMGENRAKISSSVRDQLKGLVR